MSPEEAKAAAEKAQQEVLRQLFGFLTLTGPTISASPSPTNTTNHEEETPRSRFN